MKQSRMCTISCVKLLKKFETLCRRYKSHLDMQHLFGFVFQKKAASAPPLTALISYKA